MNDRPDITQLLNLWRDGDQEAADALTPMVYDELQSLARRLFRSERKSHTLQPTALVHEAYSRLVNVDVTWQDRAHFYAIAARMMRRLLVNHANARNAVKRGGHAIRVTLDESGAAGKDPDADLLALEEGLQQLAELDRRKSELVELQYFGGLTFREMEAVTGLSSSTLDRELRMARAWLKDFLSKA
jgi:RNA polymerase sigma factor (TIGR02999 family)